MQEERPKVGIGVIIVRDGKILIGERVGNHGSGTFMIAGGHLEFGESFEQAALREAKEETGLIDLIMKGIVSISNDIAYDKHYVSITMLVESKTGEPYDAEPEKSKNWKWYDRNDLPENIFIPSRKSIKNYLGGVMYSD
ncbi:MAG: NUDIX domain-containing protein [Patescibacteria group bacterium]